MSKDKRKLSVCWKCRWLVENPGGFYKRKKKNGPCDRCLSHMTTFQIAMESMIWVKQLPKKNLAKEAKRKKYLEQRRKENEHRGTSIEKGNASKDTGVPVTDGSKQHN